MENFIQFCRRLGVHENLLFESDDLGECFASRILDQRQTTSNRRNDIKHETEFPRGREGGGQYFVRRNFSLVTLPGPMGVSITKHLNRVVEGSHFQV